MIYDIIILVPLIWTGIVPDRETQFSRVPLACTGGRERERDAYLLSILRFYLTKWLDVLDLEALKVAHQGMDISGRHVTILVLE